MNPLIVKTRADADGRLTLSVPMGAEAAHRDVTVAIVIDPTTPPSWTAERWRQFLDEIGGAWQGDFECPGPLAYEPRTPLD